MKSARDDGVDWHDTTSQAGSASARPTETMVTIGVLVGKHCVSGAREGAIL